MSVSRRLGAVLRLSSAFIVIAILAWVASAALATGPSAGFRLINARAGHTATAQVDGTLLIAGGKGDAGAVRSLEFFDPVSGKSMPGQRLFEARSGHSAIALADGRVLLAGGRNGDNEPIASTEIYDTDSGILNPGADMHRARANHTATMLADGRVLIAGGDAAGVAEIYDPERDRFESAGRLAVARAGHSAIRLGDGRVLLVGGYNAAGATAEIFDPLTNTFAVVRGGLKTSRVQPTLKLLSDGKVQVYGGDAEITMEVYNPAGHFSSRGHLLRDSGMFRSIMYSPGQAALVAIPSAKAKHYAEDALGAAASVFERTGHVATEVAARSTMVITGGFGMTGAALDTITEVGSCSGTVTTDETDYAPGETVIISGSGWTPGEQITLNLHRDTNDPPDTVLYATADENGDWINADYVVQDFDLGVTFVLTATGDSGCVAQTTFTDSVTLKTVSVAAQIPNPVINGGSATYAVTLTFNGNGSTGCSASLTTTTGAGQTGLPAGTNASFSPNPVGSTGANGASTLTIGTTAGTTPPGTYTFTVHASAPDVSGGQGCNAATADATASLVVTGGAPTTTTLASSANPSTYGGNVTLTATVKNGVNPVTTGTVNFIDGGTCALPTVTLASGVALNGSGQAAYSSSTLSAGPHPTSACYNGTASFAASSGSLTQTVNKAQLTVTADDKSRAYGSANPTFTYTITGFVNGDTAATAVTGTATCTTTATTSSAAGTYPITCTQNTLAAANYSFTFVAGTLTVTKVQLTVTADDKSKTYGAANPTLTYTITGFVNGDTAATAVTGTATCTTTAATGSAVGTYPITCTQNTLAATSYTFTFVAGTLTVNKAQLTVTADDKSKTYGSANPTLTYTITGFVNGDTAVTAVTGTATCTTTAATGSAAGTYPITCTQNTLAATNYTFTFVAGTLTVNKAQLTVTANNKSKTYGDANPAFDATITGFVNGDTLATAVTGTASCTSTATQSSAAGSYPITCALGTLAATNYTFTFVAGTLTDNPAQLTVTADNKSKTYGDANPALSYTITGFVNGDTVLVVSGTASCSTPATAASGVGSYPITCMQGSLAATNYTFTFVAGTLTVNPALLTVTADNKSKTYGDANPPLSYTITGFVNSDTVLVVSGTASCSTTATAASGVGGYPITCTQGSLAATNYTFTFAAGTLTVNPALLTVTADNKSKTYGAANPTLTYMISGFVNGDTILVVSGMASCSTTATAASGVGSYPITCMQGSLAAANYTFTFVAGTLTINPALLTVTADNKTKTYGAANPTLTYMITGFVNGDTISVVSGTASCSTVATSSPVGTYAITCTQGSLAATNYTFTFVAGTLTINPAQLTVTADNKAKTYGSPNPALTYAITGFVNGDTIAVVSGMASCSTAAASSPVGTYAITCTQGSLAATNYTFTFVAGTLTVNPALLTVTADHKVKTYSGPNPALTYTITGFVNGDTLAVVSGTATCSTTATTGSSVGNYPITCMGSLSATNYTFTFVAGTLTVNPALLTVTADNKSKTYGAPNPVLTYAITGFVNGDTIAVVGGSASCTTAAAGSPVGSYAITCSLGTLSATNYTFGFVDGTLTINMAALTVTATNTNKLFGDPIPVFAYTITGFVNGDTIAVVSGVANCTTTAMQFTTIGNYPITCTVGTLAAANYTFTTFVQGTLTITPRGALVSYIGQTMFTASGGSGTTAQVTLSASVQDPTGLGLSGAKIDFIDTSTNKVLAGGVTVSPVANSTFNGTADAIVTLSKGQFGAQSYTILVKMTGNYDNSAQPMVDKTATVVLATAAASNETTGGGDFPALSTAAGVYAGNGDAPTFSVGMTYNKGGTNPQGKITLTVPQADGVLNVQSNSIMSLSVTGKTSTIYTKADVTKILNNGTTVLIDSGVSLRMDAVDGSPDAVGFTVLSSKDSTLYYSNNWVIVSNAWRTAPQAVAAGAVLTVN